MKRYFVNPKALRKVEAKWQRNGDKVEVTIKGQRTKWQVMD